MINEEQHCRLEELSRVFLKENGKLNLSAFRTKESCWMGNIMDSLAILDQRICPLNIEGMQVLDIGTGGGFPLLPIAMCFPEVKCTGLDSTEKKIRAVENMAKELSLNNVNLICGRTEEVGNDPRFREQYDVVTARALAPLNVLLEFASPFVKPGGYIVAWKSMNTEEEMKESLLARAELSCELAGTFEYDLGESWGKRQLIFFKKRSKLHSKYPRATGIPKKSPLL